MLTKSIEFKGLYPALMVGFNADNTLDLEGLKENVKYLMAQDVYKRQAKDLTGRDLVEWLRANTDYSGVTGEVAFDENGDNVKCKAHFIQVKDGAFQHFEP